MSKAWLSKREHRVAVQALGHLLFDALQVILEWHGNLLLTKGLCPELGALILAGFAINL